jgi:hypothetical protein
MAGENLYEELKAALEEFKTFLDTNVPTIKPAVDALEGLGVPIGDLLNELATLLGQLRTEITNLDVSAIPGLDEVSSFTTGVRGILDAAKNLLPDATAEIDTVLGIADVVTGLPSLDQVKQEILDLLDAIVVHINTLKA